MIASTRTCLLLIDLQLGFYDSRWGARNNPQLETNVARLLATARSKGWPVIHVRHDSLEADSPLRSEAAGFAFLPEAEPIDGEEIFAKHAHGAFVGTGLEEFLKRRDLTEPILAGLTADHCVSTTARMANDLGLSPVVVGDAVATFPRKGMGSRVLSADDIQDAALASLDGEFARIVYIEQLL